MMRDRVFGHWITTSMLGGPDHSGPVNWRKKLQEKVKVDQKELEEHSLVKGKHRNQDCGLKKIVFGGPKENEARKVSRKAMRACGRVDFALAHHKKVSSSEYYPHKGKGKDQKRKGNEGAYPQTGFSACENPVEEGQGHPWESGDWCSNGSDDSWTTAWYNSRHFAWIASVPLELAHHPTHVVLDLGCTRSVGSRTAIRRFQKYALYHGFTAKFCPCNMSFVFANSDTETCWESCIIQFPTTPPCSTRVDVLETGDVPILFSLPQMKNLCMTIELNLTGDKITCRAFGLYSSPVECSTTGHVELDLTILANQPKSRERSARPTKHVTFAISQQKSAYPARTEELDVDEGDKPLVRSGHTTVSEDDDDKPLVQPVSRSETVKRESTSIRRVPTPLRRRKGPPVWRDPSDTLEQDVSGTSRERSEDASSLGKHSDGGALQNIVNKLSDVRNLKDFHLKHYHMSSAQIEKRTTHLDIPGKLCSHLQFDKARDLTDHALADWEQKNLEISSSWIMVRQKLEIQPLDVWLFWMVLLRT